MGKVPGGGGGLSYYHAYVGSGHFFSVQNFLFQYIYFFYLFIFFFFFLGGGGGGLGGSEK